MDILPYVAEILAETGAQIEISNNNYRATLPLIAILEVNNTSAVITDAAEQVSDISIQLDMYDYTPEKVQRLAGVVSSIMTEHGFRRGSGQLIKEESMWRRIETYGCYIDSLGRIYSGDNLV